MRNYRNLYGNLVDGTFPNIRAKNASAAGLTDGTPYSEEFINDIWGFMQAILDRANEMPTGSSEETGQSQILNAILKFIAEHTVTPSQIANNSIANEKIASGIDAGKITTGTLPNARIANNAITTARIADNAVTNAKIASGITASKISQDSTHRFVTDAEKTTWNNKNNINANVWRQGSILLQPPARGRFIFVPISLEAATSQRYLELQGGTNDVRVNGYISGIITTGVTVSGGSGHIIIEENSTYYTIPVSEAYNSSGGRIVIINENTTASGLLIIEGI